MSAEQPTRNFPAIPAEDAYATQRLPALDAVSPPADATLRLPRRVARSRRPRRGRALAAVLLSVLAVAVLAISGALLYLDRTFQGKIYPNVTIQGMPVGLMTQQEAEAALRARHGAFLRQPVTLTYGGQTWTPRPEEVGVSFDFAGAAEAAYRAGRNNGLLDNVRQVLAIWQDGLDLPLRASFDQRAMQAYVRQVAGGLEQAPVDAALIRNGTTVTTTPERPGRQVLLDDTVQELSAALTSLTPQTVPIRTRELPARLHDAEVAAAKQRLETMLQGPITLTYGGKAYTWSPEELNRLIGVARVPKDAASDRIEITFNSAPIERKIAEIAQTINRDGVNPRVNWNDGKLEIFKPGKPGLRVDEAAALQRVLDALDGKARVAALPVQEIDPPVTPANLNSLGIKELISVGRSDFTGSAEYRIHNIGAGMNLLHGILVAPGEEFSFNNAVGDIDEKNGFVKGYAIIENRTQLEFGGGICQDSTTMFRAAFWAGLPITQWRGHQFYIKWYDKYALGPYGNGAGMDATIFTGPGGQDLRFVNDTGNWLLIQAISNPKKALAEVAIYGTRPNRTVTLERRVYDYKPALTTPEFIADPNQPRGTIKQTDTARGGMTVEIKRTVIENGVARKPDIFRTKYQPWADKYAVNPADLGPDGKPLILPPSPADPNAQPTATPTPGQPDPNAQPAPAPAADPNAQPALPPLAQPDPNAQPAPTPAPQG